MREPAFYAQESIGNHRKVFKGGPLRELIEQGEHAMTYTPYTPTQLKQLAFANKREPTESLCLP